MHAFEIQTFLIWNALATFILIHILRYSSAFRVLGVRLSKYQQIHLDIQPVAQQMFNMFVYILIGASIVPLNSFMHKIA